VRFLVTTSRVMAELARRAGYLAALENFGGRLTLDTCILATSAKYAYYAPGLLNTRVTFGSLGDCVRSAIAGKVIRDESLWN